jgi:hypothetical protein
MIDVDLYAAGQKIGSGQIEGDAITRFVPHDGGPALEGRQIQVTAMSGPNKGETWTTRTLVATDVPIKLKNGCPFGD